MATYDLTLGSTKSSTAASSIAALPDVRNQAYMVEAILDISKISNYTCVNGDIFQVLEIPAGTFIVAAGAQVLTAFNVRLLRLTLTSLKAMTLLTVVTLRRLVILLPVPTVVLT